MIDGDLLVKELEKLLNDNIEKLLIPHVRGNSIRIKHHIIRKSKAGWLIYDIKENQQIAKMFSKTAAIALAKTLAQGLDEIEKIQYLDFNIKKNYNDAIFAKHSLIKTNNQIKREVCLVKYEVAKERTKLAKRKLDEYIFN